MKLTKNNYYSPEANKEFMSASFIKAVNKCPASAVAELNGEYYRPDSTALLVGSYVDAAFEGAKTFEIFRTAFASVLYKKNGELKADFTKADEMIARAKRDALFMDFMKGQKQKILTGELFGAKFKAKLDVYKKGERIVDLKTVKNMEDIYVDGQGRLSFIEAWEWDLQMAIYQALEGNNLPCYLAVITKETPSDIAIIQIPQPILDARLAELKMNIDYYEALHKGEIEPSRCEKCAYCRNTKILTKPSVLEV